MANLASKYRPKTFSEVCEQGLTMSLVKSMCESKTLENRCFLFIGPAGTGKAQPLYSKVLTPDGFITMGEVKVGQEVITHTGEVGVVRCVFPQGVRPIYEIKLSDGGKIRVADNHLNLVSVDTIDNIVTTDALFSYFAGGHTLKIPKANLSKWTFDVPEYQEYRDIVDITYIGKEECQCIYIDHPDHTYISDGFIPTHNTTTARIIANTLNEGKGEPIEIDAASHGSTEEMRQLMSQASQYPIGMKYKVIICDECHAFSSQAWQVALKTLEEQPARTIFIFCTTNPEKIPATILSRVQTFKLSKISTKGIASRLQYVIEQENNEGRGITYDTEAIEYIARLSNGGMRDSLTNLDRCLAFDKHVTLANVSQALDLPNYYEYFALLNYLVKHDNENITKVIDGVYNCGTNFVKWFEGFHSFLCNIIKYIYMKDIGATLIPSQYIDKLSAYTEAHAVICLRLSNVLLQLNKDLRTTQYQVETALTYLLTSKK